MQHGGTPNLSKEVRAIPHFGMVCLCVSVCPCLRLCVSVSLCLGVTYTLSGKGVRAVVQHGHVEESATLSIREAVAGRAARVPKHCG